MTTVAHPPKKGYRTIRLPLAESEYDRFLTDRSYAKDRLEELYEEYAELFPEAFPWGYAFFGYTEPSMKQQLLCRRIRLEQGRTVFTIAPAFVMPYMTGRTQDVDHALFLMRFHVPCWAIARRLQGVCVPDRALAPPWRGRQHPQLLFRSGQPLLQGGLLTLGQHGRAHDLHAFSP